MKKVITAAWAALLLQLPVLLPAQAQIRGTFERSLLSFVQDGVLDGQEYGYLRKIPTQTQLSGNDRQLAEHFLSFTGKATSFTQMKYGYYRGRQKVTLEFAFAPTYSEMSPLLGRTRRELLGQISQRDTLPETRYDQHRCGAAALLSAHYLLYNSFDRAFSMLGVPSHPLNFKAVHTAQDRLYHHANTDGRSGLSSVVEYLIQSDGYIKEAKPSGEVKDAARLLGMRVYPLLGETKQGLHQRERVIQNFWRMYPEAPLLVGVYLNPKTGELRVPDDGAHPQNHFVLVFRENNQNWMLNSGVSDNGNGSALYELNAKQMRGFVYTTTGSIDALTRS